MNVNLWGPDLWLVLNGVACLVNEKNVTDLGLVYSLLRRLLPCPLCLQSYITFYAEEVFRTTIEDVLLKDSVGFVYSIHSKVVKKLEQKKLEDFAKAVGGDINQFEDSKSILSSIPSRTVFDKRLYLSEGMMFSPHSVWKSLFAICLGPDLDDECKQAFNLWIKSFASVLNTSIRAEYQILSKQLEKLWKTTFVGRSPMQIFFLVALCRENMLTSNSITNDRLMEDEHAWLMLLYTRYTSTLPARSCSTVTCS
jgi:hypothetical protein